MTALHVYQQLCSQIALICAAACGYIKRTSLLLHISRGALGGGNVPTNYSHASTRLLTVSQRLFFRPAVHCLPLLAAFFD